jgi:glutamyl-tRNA reductase
VNLILVGLNHQTAPVELREQFHLAEDAVRLALAKLCGDVLTEVVIVSTCNRLEIVGWTEETERGFDVILAFLARSQHITSDQLRSSLYFLEGHDAVQHLMRVASGLESLILGETQVLGQVAHALAQAQSASTDGPILSRLFNSALHAGKRARNETAISHHTLSVSHAAVLLIKLHIDNLLPTRVLVIGAGEMAELAVQALQMHGARSICLINRTDTKAADLGQRLGIRALSWCDFPQALCNADVVIAATGAPVPIIRPEDIAASVNQPILFVDIGVPRNIAENVKDLPRVHLYDIDDLETVVDEHRALRQAEVAQVEGIIAEELETYWQWLQNRQIVPLINELRRQAETLAQSEVEQTLRRLPELSTREQEIVTQLAHRIVHKLLHTPTVRLKSRSAQGDHYDYAHAVEQLFALNESQNPGRAHDE